MHCIRNGTAAQGERASEWKARAREREREKWEWKKDKPECCEWKMNGASVNQEVSTIVKHAAGEYIRSSCSAALGAWLQCANANANPDPCPCLGTQDLNLGPTRGQCDGSSWALFHFIHLSSIVILIYYIFFAFFSLLLFALSLSLPFSLLHAPFALRSPLASSTSAGRHFASTHNGAFI